MEKIIGGKPEQQKAARESLRGSLTEKEGLFKDFEVEPTLEEKQIINAVQGAIKEAALKYSVHWDTFSNDQIVILERHSIKKILQKNTEAIYNHRSRKVFIERCKSNLKFARVLAHELIHSVGDRTFQIDESGRPVPYKLGISFYNKPNADIQYLADIEEAVVEEFAYKITQSLVGAPLFEREYEVILKLQEWLGKLAEASGKESEDLLKQIGPISGIPAPDLIEKELDSDIPDNEKWKNIVELLAEEGDFIFQSREEERKIFDRIIEEIAKRSPRNLTKDQIFDLFVKYHFGGKAPIGEIIDEALGPGSFKYIADKTARTRIRKV